MSSKTKTYILGFILISIGFLGFLWFNNPETQNCTNIKNSSNSTLQFIEEKKGEDYKLEKITNDQISDLKKASSFNCYSFQTIKGNQLSKSDVESVIATEKTEALKKFDTAYIDFTSTHSSSPEIIRDKNEYRQFIAAVDKNQSDASLKVIQIYTKELEENKVKLLQEWNSYQNSETQKEATALQSEISTWESQFALTADQKAGRDELLKDLNNLIQKIQNPTQMLEPEFDENQKELEALKNSKVELQKSLKKPQPVVQKVVVKQVKNNIPVIQKPVVQQPAGDSTNCNGEYSCFVGNSSAGKVYHYVGGKLIWKSGKATFGKSSAPTEKGLHRIYIKIRNYNLPAYPDYTSSYWIGFNPNGAGSAFHQYWGPNDNRLTVGCIKLPEADLAYIWSNSSVWQNSEKPGTLVNII